ncbi:hypothetical protein TRL7639_04049 [Falsiruegeria litorea R37]|uniref:Glycerophosphoryl diester phosphodiesterase membrane domain-containing protein n=1 Tax=Falsiruegeria litorea R37 TaxID=1200284 RepID=A0A1Y5TQC6_9RHOB|nr:hypothetical protein [Falsiruegeria litorea]SLN69559.1 hypothetical protein TRL7639_04049 [Falsiruegeria litorea R37]
MLGWRLFKHSISMIFRNLPVIIRISWFPLLCFGGAIWAFFYSIGLPLSTLWGPSVRLTGSELSSGLFLKFGLFWLFSAFLAIWGVVAWHRYVLLEEAPEGWIPKFQRTAVGTYIWRLILLVLAFLALGVPLGFLLLGVVSALGWIGITLFVVAGVVLATAFTQMAVTLPAAALEKPISFGEAWEASIDDFWQVQLLVVLVGGLQYAADWISTQLVFVPVLGFAVPLLCAAFLAMLNVSILTTLYGHFVEDRPVS